MIKDAEGPPLFGLKVLEKERENPSKTNFAWPSVIIIP